MHGKASFDIQFIHPVLDILLGRVQFLRYLFLGQIMLMVELSQYCGVFPRLCTVFKCTPFKVYTTVAIFVGFAVHADSPDRQQRHLSERPTRGRNH
ncbi:hypothetical protein BV210_00125 [Halorientalis sp. IM1011]|nr:hypothetical protein BV210_00125 [Halorientalis sp. IM1011]